MRSRLNESGSFLLRTGDRVVVGFGVAEEWIAYTPDQAMDMLNDMRLADGWKVGYFSYDLGVYMQGMSSKFKDEFKTPLLHFVRPEEVQIYEEGCYPTDCFEEGLEFFGSEPVGDLDQMEYAAQIVRIHHYLLEGETYEVNFSQRFGGKFEGEPLEVFQRLHRMNPSPHECFLNFRPVTVVSSSPERLIRGRLNSEGRLEVDTRPIKGTVPRGETSEEDKQMIDRLLASKKDEAELNMIVDLARNDLGRVCEIGSVEVTEHRVVETYSHVHHTMSNVKGLVREGLDWMDVIEAVFPGGSITGAPKFRTMQLIDELEPCVRGLYTGSAGWISPEGEFDFNILIRTLAFQQDQGRYSYHSGGAIVIDSVANEEYQETLDKAEVLRRAIC